MDRTRRRCRELKLECERGPSAGLLDKCCTWPDEAEGRSLPTFVRHAPCSSPPWDPRDLHMCSEEATERWRLGVWLEVCSHYETFNMLADAEGKSRLPLAAERKRLPFFEGASHLRRFEELRGEAEPQARLHGASFDGW